MDMSMSIDNIIELVHKCIDDVKTLTVKPKSTKHSCEVAYRYYNDVLYIKYGIEVEVVFQDRYYKALKDEKPEVNVAVQGYFKTLSTIMNA